MSPIFYETVLITRHTALCSLFTDVKPSDLALVKHLFLGTPFELDPGALKKCTAIQSLAINGFGRPVGAERIPRTDNSFWSGESLLPSRVTIFGARCSIFEGNRCPAPAALRNCTHLILEVAETDLLSVSCLLNLLPRVTHLGLYYKHPKLFSSQHLEELCAGQPHIVLLVLVHFIPWKMWDGISEYYGQDPEPHPHIISKFERLDSRIALVHVRDEKRAFYQSWVDMAAGFNDIWESGRRRLQQIRDTSIPSPFSCEQSVTN